MRGFMNHSSALDWTHLVLAMLVVCEHILPNACQVSSHMYNGEFSVCWVRTTQLIQLKQTARTMCKQKLVYRVLQAVVNDRTVGMARTICFIFWQWAGAFSPAEVDATARRVAERLLALMESYLTGGLLTIFALRSNYRHSTFSRAGCCT